MPARLCYYVALIIGLAVRNKRGGILRGAPVVFWVETCESSSHSRMEDLLDGLLLWAPKVQKYLLFPPQKLDTSCPLAPSFPWKSPSSSGEGFNNKTTTLGEKLFVLHLLVGRGSSSLAWQCVIHLPRPVSLPASLGPSSLQLPHAGFLGADAKMAFRAWDDFWEWTPMEGSTLE